MPYFSFLQGVTFAIIFFSFNGEVQWRIQLFFKIFIFPCIHEKLYIKPNSRKIKITEIIRFHNTVNISKPSKLDLS